MFGVPNPDLGEEVKAVVQPMPGMVVAKQIVYDGVLMVILGTIVAWLYRSAATPLRAGWVRGYRRALLVLFPAQG